MIEDCYFRQLHYKVRSIEVVPPNRKKKYIGLRKAILKNKDFSCIKCFFFKS